jgi:hypothetical protein
MKISPEHMKVLKDDLNSKDNRAFKEIVAFLIVFGEPLHKSLVKETEGQSTEVLEQCWNTACDIGGVFSEKFKAFGGHLKLISLNNNRNTALSYSKFARFTVKILDPFNKIES